jgi:hypothetical protein
MKTSELTGAALDWAVAKCEGFTDYDPDTETMMPPRKGYGRVNFDEYSYSTDWAHGGPIIEREKIGLTYSDSIPCWYATNQQGKRFLRLGDTPLIAAMRCYVTSKLGDNIDIPEELK